MTAPIRLHLPYPPSANDLWTVVHGRIVRTERYRRWKQAAAWAVTADRKRARVLGPYELEIRVARPDESRRDLDNLVKSLSDAIQAGGAITNDHFAQRITLEWDPSVEGVVVLILPTHDRYEERQHGEH